MALRNRTQYIQQPYNPVQQPNIERQPKVKRRKLFITKQEKLVYLASVVIVAIMAVMVLHKQGEIQTATIDIQNVEISINQVSAQNVDFKGQIAQYIGQSTAKQIVAISEDLCMFFSTTCALRASVPSKSEQIRIPENLPITSPPVLLIFYPNKIFSMLTNYETFVKVNFGFPN